MLRFIIFTFFLSVVTKLSSQSHDEKWYLVRGINSKELSEYDGHLLDSVLKIYHANAGDSVRLSCLNYISENLENEGIWPEYSKLIIERTKNKTNPFLIKVRATAFNNLALHDFHTSNIQPAIQGFQISVHLDSVIGNYSNMGNTLINMGYLFEKTGNVRAAEYYGAAIKVAELTKDYDLVGKAKADLASLYFDLGEDAYGLKLCMEAIEILKKHNAFVSLAGAYNALGSYYHDKNNIDRAYYFYTKSLEARKKTDDKEGIVSNYGNIGSIYLARKEYDKAKFYYDLQLKASEELGQDLLIAYAHDNLSSYYQRIKDLDKAEKHSLLTLESGKKLSSPELLSRASDYLYRIYRVKKNYLRSLEMLELQHRMEDSLDNQNVQKIVLKLQFKNEFEKQSADERAKAKAEQEKIKTENREKQRIQNIITVSVSAGFLLLLILAIVIFRSLQQNKKKNYIISEQKKLVEEKNKEVTDSIKYARRIQQSLMPTEKYIERNLKK
jgi:tetratricopeptide (TPR) repeat protein